MRTHSPVVVLLGRSDMAYSVTLLKYARDESHLNGVSARALRGTSTFSGAWVLANPYACSAADKMSRPSIMHARCYYQYYSLY